MTLIYDLPESDYHADPCDTPSLSSHCAATLLGKSPLHAWRSHPRLGAAPREEKDEFDRGTLLHGLLLGTGRELTIVDAKDWRTKAAQEQRDAARAAGLLPVLARQHDEAQQAAEAIGARLSSELVRLCGASEVTATWLANGIAYSRARMDHLILDEMPPAGATIYDLKFGDSAHPKACAARIARFGEDIQAAAYIDAIETIRPECAGRVSFVWLFCEWDPPYAVGVYSPSSSMLDMGRKRWRRACQLWAECVERDHWPGYPAGELSPTEWALQEEMMR